MTDMKSTPIEFYIISKHVNQLDQKTDWRFSVSYWSIFILVNFHIGLYVKAALVVIAHIQRVKYFLEISVQF